MLLVARSVAAPAYKVVTQTHNRARANAIAHAPKLALRPLRRLCAMRIESKADHPSMLDNRSAQAPSLKGRMSCLDKLGTSRNRSRQPLKFLYGFLAWHAG